MTVTRYDDYGGMLAEPNGDYVSHHAYERLRDLLAKVEHDRNNLLSECEQYKDLLIEARPWIPEGLRPDLIKRIDDAVGEGK